MHESMNKTNMLKINEVTQNMQRRKKKMQENDFFSLRNRGCRMQYGGIKQENCREN